MSASLRFSRPLLGLVAGALLAAGSALTGAASTAPSADLSMSAADLPTPLSPADDWFAAQRALPAGTSVRQAGAWARRQARGLEKDAMASAQGRQFLAAEWSNEGPFNIGGRLTDIAIPTDELNVLYVAAASGGLWRSEDAGITFTSVWPDHFSQAIGAVAVTSDGTLFVGTGEANPGGGSLVFGGDGVYRSTDHGQTWQNIGLRTSSAIGRIRIDPADDDHVWVAATGDLFLPGGERGLYESTDGGDTWELALAGDNDTTGAVDIATDPNDPDHLLVTMWDHQRTPSDRHYGGPGSALHTTFDGGQSWTRASAATGLSDDELGRIGVAIAPSLGSIAYAIVGAADGPLHGFFSSDDGGATWTQVDEGVTDPLALLGFSQSTYSWWFGRVWVDPVSPLKIWVAGVALVTSNDGGVTKSIAVGPHADHHAMAWDPQVPGRLYLGTDGGLYRHDANGASNAGWFFSPTQPWNQHYSVDVSQQDATRLVSGLQDNGVNRSYGGVAYSGVNPPTFGSPVPLTVPVDELNQEGWWNEYVGGDGLAAVTDPSNHDIVYGCSQYGNCSRSSDGGDSSGGMTKAPGTRYAWFPPLVLDPTDPSIIWSATDYVSYSTDNGQRWTTVSDDLAYQSGDDWDVDVNVNAAYPYGTASALAVGTDGDTVWVGTDNGNLWMSAVRGDDFFVEVDAGLTADDFITRITLDPEDPSRVWVTVSNYRVGRDAARLLHSWDAGATWADVSGDLPAAPLHDVLLLDGRLVVASDVGVFVSPDEGVTWFPLGGNLPMAPAMDLAHSHDGDTLVVATFGRGIWSLSLADLPQATT